MFIGHYQQVLDAKNRVFVPAKVREELGPDEHTSLYLTRGLDGCLFLYTRPQWESIVRAVQAAPFTNAMARRFQRGFASGACECHMDKQGRILIPEKLKEMAGLKKNVAFVGVFDRVEIWDSDKWADVELKDNEYDEAAEALKLSSVIPPPAGGPTRETE